MINCFITCLLAVLSFSFLSISLNLQSANRVIMYTPKQIFETSIPILQNVDEFIPYFDKELLTSKLKSYYDDNLTQYTVNYSLNIYFYNQEDGSLCISDACQAVEVEVKAEIIFSCGIERTIFYEIRNGAYGK